MTDATFMTPAELDDHIADLQKQKRELESQLADPTQKENRRTKRDALLGRLVRVQRLAEGHDYTPEELADLAAGDPEGAVGLYDAFVLKADGWVPVKVGAETHWRPAKVGAPRARGGGPREEGVRGRNPASAPRARGWTILSSARADPLTLGLLQRARLLVVSVPRPRT